MSERRHGLVYHSLHRRHVTGGCMPVFFLLALAALVGLLLLTEVEMTPRPRPMGQGNILHRQDQLLETQIRQRSPLPLLLPRYIAPLRMDEGIVNLPLRRTLTAAEAPEELPFATGADSVVLNRAALLELPPEAPAPADAEAPAGDDGKEAE